MSAKAQESVNNPSLVCSLVEPLLEETFGCTDNSGIIIHDYSVILNNIQPTSNIMAASNHGIIITVLLL